MKRKYPKNPKFQNSENFDGTPNNIEKEIEVISYETKKDILKKEHNIEVDYKGNYERTESKINKIKNKYEDEKLEAKQEISKYKEVSPKSEKTFEQSRRNKEKVEEIENSLY